MSSLLHSVGRWSAHHAKTVLIAWLGLIGIMVAGYTAVGMQLTSEYAINGTESIDGLSILAERLPQAAGASEQILFTATSGSITDHKDAIETFIDEVRKIDGISMVSDPFGTSTNTISSDGLHALAQVQTDSTVGSSAGASTPKATEVSDELNKILASTHDAGLSIQRSESIGTSITVALSVTELIGVAVAAIVLLITFGSALTAGVPILSAFIGVAAGMLGILLVASVVKVNSTTPALAVMIGLAVGIDYALFIISRAREYLAKGIEPREAAARAVATAGSAVVFAGGTVIIALCGLVVAGIPFLATMGFAAASMVAVAVAVAITAVPAFLSLIGHRAAPKARKRASEGKTGMGARWVRGVMKHPIVAIVAVVGILGVTAIPITRLQLALTDNGYEPVGTAARTSYDAISEAYGPGYNSPIIVIADIVQTTDPVTVVNDMSSDLAKLDGVDKVALATPNADGSFAFIQIIPTNGQADKATEDLVKEIRADAPTLEDRYGISNVMVTGQTAVAIDIASQLNSALLPFGLVVVGLSIIILMIVFRSIAVPLTATLGYVLSLGAGMGAVGAVYGYGWAADLLNVSKTGAVISFLPVIVMGILFGLAMDYQVFLVSRMLEEWTHRRDARRAVEAGFIGSAPVVTAAAIIMTAVFAAFIPEGMVQIKPIAIALTVGIAADAFLVRMTFIPAIMTLLGPAAWWMPRWLDRLLPVVDVEGLGLARALEYQEWEKHNGPAAVRLSDMTVSDGDDTVIDRLNFVVRPGEVGILLNDDPAYRMALAAVIEGRLRVTEGIAVVGGNALPDGTARIQGMTAVIRAWDDEVSDAAQIVVVDDPGERRWRRIRELHSEGRTVVVTGPRSLDVPADLVSVPVAASVSASK